MNREPLKQCGKHCPHPTGTSRTTLLYGVGNSGETDVKCCRCGAYGVEKWHEESRRMKGHGPYVTETAQVSDGYAWVEWTLTTSEPEGGWSWVNAAPEPPAPPPEAA